MWTYNSMRPGEPRNRRGRPDSTRRGAGLSPHRLDQGQGLAPDAGEAGAGEGLDLGAEVVGEGGSAPLDRGLEGLERLELDRLDLVLPLELGLERQDPGEVGRREHLAHRAACREVAPSAEGDGGVVSDESVLVVEPCAEGHVGRLAAEEA